MIETWTRRGRRREHAPEAILLELPSAIHKHPWWTARARLTIRLLASLGIAPGATVLDAGCGWGTTLDALDRAGYRASGMDISRKTLEQLDRPGRALFVADLARDMAQPVASFDAVLALDVIEHIDDDRGAVARLARLVRPGGVLIVSVPALPEFFSEFDAVQGHRRRYLPPSLRDAFNGSPLAVDRVFWWGQWLVPILRRQRMKTKRQAGDSPSQTYARYLALPPWPAPWIMSLAFALEERPALRGRLHTGTSLFAVARRPPEFS